MFNLKIDFHCQLCGEKYNFYIMPLDEKVNEKDTVPSLNHYKIQCKKCKKSYILTFNIEMV